MVVLILEKKILGGVNNGYYEIMTTFIIIIINKTMTMIITQNKNINHKNYCWEHCRIKLGNKMAKTMTGF